MSNSQPLVSIITCTHNSQKYLDRCLSSIDSQNYPNYEHIIVDGLSTDLTMEILNKYKHAHSKRKIIILQSQPLGIANAFNIGVRASNGDIIHFLNSDDYYYNNTSLSRAVVYFQNNPITNWIVGNQVFLIKNTTIIFRNNVFLRVFLPKFIHIFPCLSHTNMFYKSSIFKKYGFFNESYKNSLDFDHQLRIIKHEPLKMLDDNFSVFRIHLHSTTFNPHNYIRLIKEDFRAIVSNL
jgi:glycosyltransferase involved in cell wall biosynthesis